MIVAQQTEVLQAVEPWLFYPVAGLAAMGALGVVFSQQIVRMAVYLLFTLGAVALTYFLLGAEFLAAIQLIVYVGGTLILIIFGVMLTSKNPFVGLIVSGRERALGWGIGFLATALMTGLGLSYTLSASSPPTAGGAGAVLPIAPVTLAGSSRFGVELMGIQLLSKYMVPFELAGVLLLVVMIGAAYIAKGRHMTPDVTEQGAPGTHGGGFQS